MKNTFFIIILLLALAGTQISPQEKDFPVLEGPYFGQKLPGMTPEIFAPGIISTEGYDITPTFSPGLDEVFFGRRPTEGGSDNKLYYSMMSGGRWKEPELAPFSSEAVEFEAQFSCDGKKVVFNRGRKLFVSEKTDKGWSEAKNMESPIDEGMCAAMAQNDNIYFTAARAKTYGIFRAKFQNRVYQTPEIIVRMAAHPFVSPDESYLLFDKYSFEGEAQKSKLYVSFRQKDGSWSDPVEFGEEINKTGTELIPKVSPDGKYMFFQRKVNGNTDIFWVDAKIIGRLRR